MLPGWRLHSTDALLMRLFFLLALCASFCASVSTAQVRSTSEPYTVRGIVKDAETGVILSGATVASTQTPRGVAANRAGQFEIHLDRSPDALRVSFVGYETVTVTVGRASADTVVVVQLQLSTSSSGEATVTAESQTVVEDVRSGVSRIGTVEIRDTPQVLGEPDALKALQLLPGVSAGKEGTAGLNVRGSGPGQNLILLDGLPLYGTTHLFGFFSAFPTEALDQVVLLRGAFPARYAGRLASVIDLQTRAGSAERLGVQASVGLLSSQLVAEGPIGHGASILVAGRRTYIDVFTRALRREGGYSLDPYFTDGYARLDVPLGSAELTVSGYASRDAFAFQDGGVARRESSEIGWTNALGSARLRGGFGPLRLEAGAGAVAYGVGTRQDVEQGYPNDEEPLVGAGPAPGVPTEVDRFSTEYSSRAEDARVWLHGALGDLGFGATEAGLFASRHRYDPAASRLTSSGALGTDSTSSGAPSSSTEAGAYLEHDVAVGPLRVAVGAHVGYYKAEGVADISFQPRLAARLRLGDLALKASYARTTQPVHLLTNGALGLPTELWLPATALAPPSRADQWSAGAAYAPAASPWTVTADLYLKRERGLVEYLDGASFADASSSRWEDGVAVGTGRSVGIEVLLERRIGPLTWRLGYTLSRTTRRFAGIDGGTSFLAPFDRTHDVSLVGSYQLRPRVSLQGSWVFSTGQAVTLPVGDTYFCWGGQAGLSEECGVYTEYGPRNGARLPAYHRLDVAARFGRLGGRVGWTLGLTNAYNARNPFYVTRNPGGATTLSGREYDERYLRGFTLFPTLPFARVDIRF